jgi:hypothetical protein
MVQRGNNMRFPFEAGAEIFALGDVFGQNLNQEGAVEPRVAGFVHLPHAAGAEWEENLVRAEFVSSVEAHLSQLSLADQQAVQSCVTGKPEEIRPMPGGAARRIGVPGAA